MWMMSWEACISHPHGQWAAGSNAEQGRLHRRFGHSASLISAASAKKATRGSHIGDAHLDQLGLTRKMSLNIRPVWMQSFRLWSCVGSLFLSKLLGLIAIICIA